MNKCIQFDCQQNGQIIILYATLALQITALYV